MTISDSTGNISDNEIKSAVNIFGVYNNSCL